MITEEQATEYIEALQEPYGKKATALLGWLGEQLAEKGMTVSEVIDMCSDSYMWNLMIGRAGKDKSVDISIEIHEAHEFGDGPEDGVNFRLDIVKYGGEILGGFAPHNYTDLCWVSASDPEQVTYRWSELEGQVRSSSEQIVDMLLTKSECSSCGFEHPQCVAVTRCCDECSHELELAVRR